MRASPLLPFFLLLLAVAASGCGGLMCRPEPTTVALANDSDRPHSFHVRLLDGGGRLLVEGDVSVPAGGLDGLPEGFKTFDGTLVGHVTVEGREHQASTEFSECWGGVTLHYDGSGVRFGGNAA